MTKKPESDIVAVLVLCAVIIAIVLIPLRIVGYGYLPEDDALRHAAKAVSGKSWNDILVMRPGVIMDCHYGWHTILSFLHRTMALNTDGLVVFSVVSLFLFFSLIPIFFLKRPEVWPLTLLIFSLTDMSLFRRLLFGRPYIVTMTMVLVLCFTWQKFKAKKFPLVPALTIMLLTSLATWVHGSWYLLALPIACFFLAREWRAGCIVAGSVICGVILGAVLTGHPYLFLRDNIAHMFYALGGQTITRMLVTEFQPFSGDVLAVFVVVGLIGWRYMRGEWKRNAIDNPVFILIVAGWILAFTVKRFWFDWAMPALCVWMVTELQDGFERLNHPYSWRRFCVAMTIILACYLGLTNDAGSRWTQNLTIEYLSASDQKQAPWLPEPGGIIYSDDMGVFYETFFRNPEAPWRYILGYEAALMPTEDLATFRKIQWNHGTPEAYEPWVKKMRPQDRLILRRGSGANPGIGGLEWYYAATNTWIGRLPKPSKK